MFSLRHCNRNTTWFIILFSPTINSFFLQKNLQVLKRDGIFQRGLLNLSSFTFGSLEGVRRAGTGAPHSPRALAAQPLDPEKIHPWLLGTTLGRDRCVPVDIWAPSRAVPKPFLEEGWQWEMLLSSHSRPPVTRMLEPPLPHCTLQSGSD